MSSTQSSSLTHIEPRETFQDRRIVNRINYISHILICCRVSCRSIGSIKTTSIRRERNNKSYFNSMHTQHCEKINFNWNWFINWLARKYGRVCVHFVYCLGWRKYSMASRRWHKFDWSVGAKKMKKKKLWHGRKTSTINYNWMQLKCDCKLLTTART